MSYNIIPLYDKNSISESFDGVSHLHDAIPFTTPKNIEELEATLEKLFGKDIKISVPDIYLEPQEEGGFVAFSREYSGAVGQGETIEEAIKDLEEAIELLKEVLEEDKAREQER